ncbi:MAG: helix-turn-helix domain-containing protein [Candidatus Micrarchaeota archaeon]
MAEEKKLIHPIHPVIFEVDINHLCWFVDITEKNPDATLVSTMSTVHGDLITNIVQLTSPNPREDIERIKKHPLVKKVEILALAPTSALLSVTSSYKAMTYKILHQTNVKLLESPVTRGGLDSEILLAPSHKDMADLLGLWKEQKGYAEVKLKRKRYLKPEDVRSLSVFRTAGFFDLQSAKELITPKQLEIFQLACDYGYYETPKKISIEELAQRTGLSPSTLAEHLRKAEAKLLPVFWKVLRKL